MEEVLYSLAVPDDEIEIKALLAQCQLPTDDISPHLQNFIEARLSGKLVGVIGLEICGKSGLLRSLAVDPAFRGHGIARTLHTQIYARAKLSQLQDLYLLTNTASEYARRLGFGIIDKNSVPNLIQSSQEFQILCPNTSICMMKALCQ
jgi:amino-acid N-acetyltransferase